MNLPARLGRLEGRDKPDPAAVAQARVRVDTTVRTARASATAEERARMTDWWTMCERLVESDPLLATVYAAMTWDDLTL